MSGQLEQSVPFHWWEQLHVQPVPRLPETLSAWPLQSKVLLHSGAQLG